MKLTDQEFKRFKELQSKVKSNKASDKEKQELEALMAKKKEGKRQEEFKPGNDFSWWNKIPELIRDSANFKCNWIPGTPVAPNYIQEVGVGVVAYQLETVYGNSVSATDPINTWARDLYLRMFQKYRPASGYSASDLGIAIIAGVEVVKLIAYYERIYGIINRYSKLNVNMPNIEAQALGLSVGQVTYLQGHLSDFRYDLNILIRKAQRLCVPKDLSVLADAISLFGYEYIDHESPRSQIILFKPATYAIYSDTRFTSGGSILFHDNLEGDAFDFNADNMCKALEASLNPLLGSDSIQRIYADLVVWFGNDAMLTIMPVPEDYTIAPVKSESILHKMHNMETVSNSTYRMTTFADGSLPSAEAGTVISDHFLYQVDDRIVTTCCMVDVPSGAVNTPVNVNVHGIAGQVGASSGGAPYGIVFSHALDTYRVDVEPDVVVEGSLFKFDVDRIVDQNSVCCMIQTAGFYICRKVTTYRNTASGVDNYVLTDINGQARPIAGALACLDWAPLAINFDPNTFVISNIWGDYDNIIHISSPDLARIHRSVILSGMFTDMTVVNK